MSTSMSLFEKIENVGHECLTAAEHGAAWLVGQVACAQASLATLEASSPLVAEAISAGIASANAHGVPVGAIENIGDEVLAGAKQLAASLASPPPLPAATVAGSAGP